MLSPEVTTNQKFISMCTYRFMEIKKSLVTILAAASLGTANTGEVKKFPEYMYVDQNQVQSVLDYVNKPENCLDIKQRDKTKFNDPSKVCQAIIGDTVVSYEDYNGESFLNLKHLSGSNMNAGESYVFINSQHPQYKGIILNRSQIFPAETKIPEDAFGLNYSKGLLKYVYERIN